MLDSNMLRYSPFHDSRKDTKPGFHQGGSGSLLLATSHPDSCAATFFSYYYPVFVTKFRTSREAIS